MSKVGISGLFGALLCALMGFWLLADGIRTLNLEARLSQIDGEHTTAVVDDMWYTQGRFDHNYMTFHFVAGMQTVHSQIETSDGVWHHQFIGHTVPVVYLKDDPQVAKLDLPGEYSFRKHDAELSIGFGAFLIGLLCFGLLRRVYQFLVQRNERGDLES